MKSTDFLVEDYCKIAWDEFLSDLNVDNNSVFLKEAEEGNDIREFAVRNSDQCIIGGLYYFITVLWMPGEKNAISLATSDDLYEVLSIRDDGRISVFNTVTKKLRVFPEIAGQVENNPWCSTMFNTLIKRDQFLTLFHLKFSQWKLLDKTL